MNARMGAMLAGLYAAGRMVSWQMTRFSAGWWFMEVVQVGVIIVATYLILAEMKRLEVQVERLRARLDGIAKLMRNVLGLEKEWKRSRKVA